VARDRPGWGCAQPLRGRWATDLGAEETTMSTNKLVTVAMTIGTAFVGAVRATATAATLHVPGDFATIQACIEAAVSGVD